MELKDEAELAVAKFRERARIVQREQVLSSNRTLPALGVSRLPSTWSRVDLPTPD